MSVLTVLLKLGMLNSRHNMEMIAVENALKIVKKIIKKMKKALDFL